MLPSPSFLMALDFLHLLLLQRLTLVVGLCLGCPPFLHLLLLVWIVHLPRCGAFQVRVLRWTSSLKVCCATWLFVCSVSLGISSTEGLHGLSLWLMVPWSRWGGVSSVVMLSWFLVAPFCICHSFGWGEGCWIICHWMYSGFLCGIRRWSFSLLQEYGAHAISRCISV